MDEVVAPITSHRNPLIKQIRALAKREERQREHLIVVEGLRAIIAAVDAQLPITTVVYAPERIRSQLAQRTLATLTARGTNMNIAVASILDDLSERDASQGIVAIMPRPVVDLHRLPHVATNPLVIVLHEPQDPGNVGTIARTADSAGAAALVTIGTQGVDVFDPKAIRASMGSLFAMPVIELGEITHAVKILQSVGYALIGTSDKGAVNLWDVPMTGPVALLMGNERAGLPAEVMAACTTLARIPLTGTADSLNVAAAAAIFLFEAVRQRQGQ